MATRSPELKLPDEGQLIAELRTLAGTVEPIERYVEAVESGLFRHPDGRVDRLEDVVISLAEGALISHLARDCTTVISVETGFGMGSSAALILGTRQSVGIPYEHYAFDPYGLPDNRGAIVEDYLADFFRGRFHRVWERAEIGLAALLRERGAGSVGLAFIDGAHRFENVMVDFMLADALCSDGGYIAFDDAWYPAIETAISYIAANRPDYALAHLPVGNISVIQKQGLDRRPWYSFKPFAVPEREDWIALPGAIA